MATKTDCCAECSFYDRELKGIEQAKKALLEREHTIRQELQRNYNQHVKAKVGLK